VDRVLCLETFLRVAEHQSFVGAARELRVAPSVISARIKQLEEYLQAPLFYRSTREVTLSEAGHACLEEGKQLLDRFEALAESTRTSHAVPSGVLRLRILPGLTNGQFGRILNLFQKEHPNLLLDISVTNGLPVNNVDASFDVSLQLDPPSAETQMIARPLCPYELIFCASPEYLEEFGVPKEPHDLEEHRFCAYSVSPERNRFRFILNEKEEVTIHTKDQCITNSMDVLHDLACGGNGIACLPKDLFLRSLTNGKLVRVLADYVLPAPMLLAVFPVIYREARKVRIFIDFVRKHIEKEAVLSRPRVAETQSAE